MQSHQRYFPLGGNRFAVVANGGDPETILPGYRAVLENRLDDAAFTFDRDVAKGIEGLAAGSARSRSSPARARSRTRRERLVDLVDAPRRRGGIAIEAARLAKADQAAELVREFAELEGHIGAEYARLAGYPEAVATAIEDQYLPDAAGAPLPRSEAGRLLAAADKLDNLRVTFGLGKRPTGSRDPFGLRRAAIGLCRLADEGGVTVARDLLAGRRARVRRGAARRAARRAGRAGAGRAALRDEPSRRRRRARPRARRARRADARLGAHGLHARPADLGRRAPGAVDPERFEPTPSATSGSRSSGAARNRRRARGRLRHRVRSGRGARPDGRAVLRGRARDGGGRAVRANRLRLLLAVRDDVGALGDFSQIPI